MKAPSAAHGKTVLLAAAAVALSVSLAGAVSPTDLNLFSGEPSVKPEAPREAANPVLNFLVQKLGSRQNPAGVTPPVAGTMNHTLVFQDGRQLCGELVSLGKDQVIWKRGDASAELTFSRSEIRFIALSPDAQPGNQNMWAAQQVTIGETDSPPIQPSPATVKLPGGDWLYATVKSTDGETFELSLGGDSKFTVPRSAIEWMHFGLAPAPAIHLSNDRMALAGWLRGGGKAEIQMDHGWMTMPQVDWIGKNVSPPPRFEVRFDLDAEDKRNTTLWIQPFGPQPNCYGPGTIELRFSKGKLGRCIYINNINREESDLPQEAGPEGRASYRVFYDGVNAKLSLTRNGKQVGDWKLRDEKEVKNQGWQRGINGVCLQRDGGMRLGQFVVQPWDGVIPKEGEAERTQDSLAIGKVAPMLGKLESIDEKELIFSGEKRVSGGGAFLQLHSQPKAMETADVSLMFGPQGELGAAEVAIENGRAKFLTSFAGAVEMPLSALKVIRLMQPEAAGKRPTTMGALVFKNGDELPGTLVSAVSGAPLRWKTVGGQELDFQPGRVSGVLFPPAASKPDATSARVELRNGDQLRGTIAGFGKEDVQVKSERLGVVKIPREKIWSIYPDPKTSIFDAASDPDPWMAMNISGNAKEATVTRRTDCVNLNGFFLMRTPGGGLESNQGNAGIGRNLAGMPEKFEVRCETLEPMGQEPNLSIRFMTTDDKGNPSTLDLQFYYGSLRVYGWVNNRNNGHSFWKDVTLREQNGRYQPEPRVAIRLFVDNKAGTVDVYYNGVHRIKAGQATNERIPGIGGSVTIQGSSSTAAPLVVSNVWAGPWNGQLPEPGEGPAMALANGDVADTVPVEMRDGKLRLDAAGAELEVPLERVQAIGFGGKPDPAASAGRLRLASGDSVAVDAFQFGEGTINAHSPVLGDMKIPADALRELVFDAAPVRFPSVSEKKKKTAENGGANPQPRIVLPQ